MRGINFHTNQPLFVSGGDDYKIKVCFKCLLYFSNACHQWMSLEAGVVRLVVLERDLLGEGNIHNNPASGYHPTAPSHWKSQWNIYQPDTCQELGEGRENFEYGN